MPSAANSPALKIGNRNADAHRPVSRQAGDRHQPAHALRDLVEAGPVGVRPILAEAGDAGVDEARIDARQRLVVDAQALLHAGPEILHDHVRLLHHALERGEAFRRLEVQRHAALVAVQVLEVGALARAAHRLLRPGRRFDLDDVGAPVGELARASRPGPHAGEVEDGETGQGFRRPRERHSATPAPRVRSKGDGLRAAAHRSFAAARRAGAPITAHGHWGRELPRSCRGCLPAREACRPALHLAERGGRQPSFRHYRRTMWMHSGS